jgi:hypothetical protein
MNRLLTILLSTVLPMLAMAQRPHPILTEFSGFRQDDGIMLKWVIAGGNQCNGISIYRALEQGGFVRVGNIAGICGSTDSDETYTFLDTTALRNRDNSYRLELGWQGYTEVITVFFSDLSLGRHARLTDPVDGSVRFIFDNPRQLPVNIELFDIAGVAVIRETTRNTEFLLRQDGLRPGVYIYRIGTDGMQPVVGRMTIGH